jgi:hypothetical protein
MAVLVSTSLFINILRPQGKILQCEKLIDGPRQWVTHTLRAAENAGVLGRQTDKTLAISKREPGNPGSLPIYIFIPAAVR